MLDLQTTNELCRLLSDPTRVRLLALVVDEALSVAELTEVTGLAQSRVSTHLGKLKDAGMVVVRRQGQTSYYAHAAGAAPEAARVFWSGLSAQLDDPTLARDRACARRLVEARNRERSWADSVAGQMDRHYSPGRTWESFVRGLIGLMRLGDVLDLASGDGALAELIAPRARSVTCLDVSEAVVEAGRARLRHLEHVRFVRGDMHRPPLEDASFDQVLLMNALTYAEDADLVLREAARLLRPGRDLVLTTLHTHDHSDVVAGFDHVNRGFAPTALRASLEAAGFTVTQCDTTHEETRAPHFKILTAYAKKRD